MKTILTCILLFAANLVLADESETNTGLSLELIMQDPDWIGNTLTNVYFDYKTTKVYVEQKQTGESFSNQFEIDLVTTDLLTPDLLIPNQEQPLKSEQKKIPKPLDSAIRQYNNAYTAFTFSRQGDIYYRNLTEPNLIQVTQTLSTEHSPRFTPNGSNIIFQEGSKVFLYDLPSQQTRQIAEFRAEADPLVKNVDYSFLGEQKKLFSELSEAARKTQNKDKTKKARQTADTNRAPASLYLGDELEIVKIYPSPDGSRSLVVTKSKTNKAGEKAKMPSYVTENGYVDFKEVRTKVGENEPNHHEAWLIEHDGTVTTQLSLASLPGIDQDPLKKLRRTALKWHLAKGGDEDTLKKQLEAPEQRLVRIPSIIWNNAGTHAALLIFSIDNKDRWIATMESAANTISNTISKNSTLKSQHRLSAPDSWVGYAHNEFGWSRDHQSLWFLSEEDGYSHLFTKSLNSKKANQLTRGAFIVESPMLNQKGSQFYFIANKENSGRYHLYRMGLQGGELEQLSDRIIDPRSLGNRNGQPFELSPDESKILFKHGRSNRPPELYITDNPAKASSIPKSKQLSTTTSPQFLSHNWQTPRFVEIPSTHFNGSIKARLYEPSAPSALPRPAVIFVHGAGYLQNAHESWSAYFREYMFHQLLNEHGITVLDIDYRGSRGYGAAWRSAIYQRMGHPELEDIRDSVNWLVKHQQVDPERLGIYGGSYGGFLTLMTMFRQPDLFAAGAALRPVTDWAHYNHGYTSNILNTPLLDPEAYERSSPIYYAEHYNNRPLLIAHGMQDDNVHVQDSIRLTQRLIELEKENFETAYYPLDPHGFKHASSWLDEYRRIFKLFKAM